MRIDSAGPTSKSVQYSPAAPGEALRLGSTGPEVVALQQRLNALGARPQLATDGQLGPKTQAAMTALLGSPVLDDAAKAKLAAPKAPAAPADGFQPASTAPMPSLDTQAAQTTPVTAAPSTSGVAGKVVDQAFAENDSINPFKRGDDGKVKGWQQLQTVFEQTTGWKPSDSDCQTVIPGSGIKPGGKSWCGIWATHIYQQAGVNVKWDLTQGKMVGDVTQTMAPKFSSPAQYKAERQAFEQSVKPGDVITLAGSGNHHAIVTQVNPDGTVETMDGNKPQVGPGHQKLSDVTSFYRPNNA